MPPTRSTQATLSLVALTLLVAAPWAHTQAASPQTPPAPLTRAQLLRNLDPDMAEVILLYDAIKGTPAVNLL